MSSEDIVCQLEELPLDSSRMYIWELRNRILRSYPIRLVRRIFLLVSSRARVIFGTQTKQDKKIQVVLNLQPGELVEVRSEEEILATLDKRGNFQGMTFLPEMRQFCGKKFRVFKRLERMIVEGKGMRRIKNTVLLEGVICNGEAHWGCDRSCFCMWREVWLKRAE